MVKNKMSDDMREDVLETIMAGVGLVLSSKAGAKPNPALDRECAVNVLNMLEDEGFKVAKDAKRS
jgi:hypothetical protein